MPLPYTSLGEVIIFNDDFLGASLNPAIAGTSENSGTAAIVVGQRGGVGGLTTGATSGNRSQFTTGLNYRAADGSIVVAWRVANITATSSRSLFVGVGDSVSLKSPITLSGTTFTANDTDAVGFVFDTASTDPDYWYGVGVNNGTITGGSAIQVNGKSVSPTAGVFENFVIEITPEGLAILSYGKDNGVDTSQGVREVARISSALRTSVNLTPVVALQTRTAGAATAYVDALYTLSSRQMS